MTQLTTSGALHALRLRNAVLGTLAPNATGRRYANAFMTPRRRSPEPPADADRVELPSGLVAWRRTPTSVHGRAVLLHGWESHAGHLDTLADALVAQGMQVFALDAPAHGASPGATAHPLAFAAALTDAVTAVGPVDVAIGHSMGGGAVLLAASEGLPVERVVSIAAPGTRVRQLMGQ